MGSSRNQFVHRNLFNANNQLCGPQVFGHKASSRHVFSVLDGAHRAGLYPNLPVGVAVQQFAALGRIQYGALVGRNFFFAEDT